MERMNNQTVESEISLLGDDDSSATNESTSRSKPIGTEEEVIDIEKEVIEEDFIQQPSSLRKLNLRTRSTQKYNKNSPADSLTFPITVEQDCPDIVHIEKKVPKSVQEKIKKELQNRWPELRMHYAKAEVTQTKLLWNRACTFITRLLTDFNGDDPLYTPGLRFIKRDDRSELFDEMIVMLSVLYPITRDDGKPILMIDDCPGIIGGMDAGHLFFTFMDSLEARRIELVGVKMMVPWFAVIPITTYPTGPVYRGKMEYGGSMEPDDDDKTPPGYTMFAIESNNQIWEVGQIWKWQGEYFMLLGMRFMQKSKVNYFFIFNNALAIRDNSFVPTSQGIHKKNQPLWKKVVDSGDLVLVNDEDANVARSRR
jgi:hypothetical protein